MQRVLWVDYAKAIGIILVVYGHITRGLNQSVMHQDSNLFHLLDSVIYTFHMPLFFFLAGLFFVDQLNALKNSGLISNKLKTLMYPYVIWSLLQGLIEVFLSRYTNGNVAIIKILSFMVEPRAQFWFLYVLFFITLVSTFIYSSISKKAYFLVFVVFAFLYIVKDEISFIYITDGIVGSAVFFCLGIFFKEIKYYFEENYRYLTFTFGALFVFSQYLFHITFNLNYTVYGIPVLVLAVISIFFVVSISIWLSKVSIGWLAFIGMSSMSIYLMHIIIGSGTRILLYKLFGIDSTVIHVFFGVLAAISIPLLAQALMNRYQFNFLLKFPF